MGELSEQLFYGGPPIVKEEEIPRIFADFKISKYMEISNCFWAPLYWRRLRKEWIENLLEAEKEPPKGAEGYYLRDQILFLKKIKNLVAFRRECGHNAVAYSTGVEMTLKSDGVVWVWHEFMPKEIRPGLAVFPPPGKKLA